MTRVAHVLRKYNPDEWGGTETHVVEVTRRLGAGGFACEVHAPRGPSARDRWLSPDVPLRRYHSFLPFLGTRERRRALVANAGNIVSLEEPLRVWRDRGLGLAHLHTTGRIGGGIRTAMRATGRPYVVSVHGPQAADQAWLEHDTRRRLAGTVDLGKPIGLVLGARRVLDDAARVICFNEAERRALAERVGDRAVRMDHGVDRERFAGGDARRGRGRWPELEDAPVICQVGRLCAQKNQLLAVRAFAAGAPADHRLALAGSTTDHGYRDRIEALVRELGVQSRVHVLGNLEVSDVPDLYALSRLLLIPSTQEAFGLIVLEGLAAGIPVLFARRSGLADVAEALGVDEATVDGDEPDRWAHALKRSLGDDRLRTTILGAGDAVLGRRYNWDVVADELAALYRRVLSEHRNP